MNKAITELEKLVDNSPQKLKAFKEEDAVIKPAPGKWSKKEILGHLIDSAANNHHRFVRAQYVEKFTFPKYEQEEWVRLQNYNSVPWSDLIEFWRLYNLHLIHITKNIPDQNMKILCIVETIEPVTLEFLIGDYVEHMKKHLKQIGL